MCDLLDLGLEPDHVRGKGAERDAGRGGGRGILARHLEQAGIRDAEIGVAPQLSNRRFSSLESFTPVARAWLRDG